MGNWINVHVAELERDLAVAQARIEALEKLLPYVQHRPHCWAEVNPIIGIGAPQQMCPCGLEEAKAARAAVEGK